MAFMPTLQVVIKARIKFKLSIEEKTSRTRCCENLLSVDLQSTFKLELSRRVERFIDTVFFIYRFAIIIILKATIK